MPPAVLCLALATTLAACKTWRAPAAPPWILDNMVENPDALRRISHFEYLRESGSEGIELVMWLIMRGALGDDVTMLHRFYHVPAPNTAVGHLILKPSTRE